MDCEDRDPEYYMLYDWVWEEVVPDRKGMLCLDCVEKRLKRALYREDFRFTPLEMRLRLDSPARVLKAWEIVLGDFFTNHKFFEILARGRTLGQFQETLVELADMKVVIRRGSRQKQYAESSIENDLDEWGELVDGE